MSYSNYIGLLYICTYSVHISTACLVVARLCSTLLPSSKAKQSFLQLRLLPQGPSSWEQISSPGVAAKSHESAWSCTHAPAGWAVWDGPDPRGRSRTRKNSMMGCLPPTTRRPENGLTRTTCSTRPRYGRTHPVAPVLRRCGKPPRVASPCNDILWSNPPVTSCHWPPPEDGLSF